MCFVPRKKSPTEKSGSTCTLREKENFFFFLVVDKLKTWLKLFSKKNCSIFQSTARNSTRVVSCTTCETTSGLARRVSIYLRAPRYFCVNIFRETDCCFSVMIKQINRVAANFELWCKFVGHTCSFVFAISAGERGIVAQLTRHSHKLCANLLRKFHFGKSSWNVDSEMDFIILRRW